MRNRILLPAAIMASLCCLSLPAAQAQASMGSVLAFAALTMHEGFMCKSGVAHQAKCVSDSICDQFSRCRNLYDMSLQSLWASEAAYQDRRWNVDYRRESLARVGLTERKYIAHAEWLFGDAEVVIAENSTVIVVAVSGTEMNAADIETDLDFTAVVPSRDWTPVDLSSPAWAGVAVHEGFFEYAKTVWPDVARELRGALATKRRPIRFVGHSLGGAVAQLLALRAHWQIEAVDAVVTFGSPKVGNWVYESAYEDSLHFATYRWVNDDDAVPNLAPFDSWKRAGQQLYMSYAGDDDRPSFNTGIIEYVSPFADPDYPPTLEYNSPDYPLRVLDRNWDDHKLMSGYLPMIEGFSPCDHRWRTTRWGCP